jgi:hypothetical protein
MRYPQQDIHVLGCCHIQSDWELSEFDSIDEEREVVA